MGEKGNLEPATVVDGDAGRSAASVAVGVAATSGAKLTDAVIAESAGAAVGAAAERLKKDEDEEEGEAPAEP